MKSFNVTTATIEGYPHTRALAEAAEYVHWCLVLAGFGSALTTGRIDADAHNIVFCAHLLDAENVGALPADTIIFNSEQLQHETGWYFEGRPYRQCLERFYVWDYSIKNLARIPHERKFFIPFLFCRDLVRRDLARMAGRELCFFGSMTERREALIAKLAAAGVPVEAMFAKYGRERDEKMFRSWAVLNLRQLDQIITFEPVRCFYPLTNGIPVISEAAHSDPTFAYYQDWLFAFDTADFVRETARLYHDPDAFAAEAAEKRAAFRATSGAEAIKEAVEAYLESTR